MRGNVRTLIDTLPQAGQVERILLRPERKAPMVSVVQSRAIVGKGLAGDRFDGRPESKRQVTFFQAENLPFIASVMQMSEVDPLLLRRNVIVRGINLHALSGRSFVIGGAIFEGAGQCHPCSRMEKVLGPGGFNAMRGIGGLCARVLQEGEFAVGDSVYLVELNND